MNGILINVRVTLTWTRPKKIISNYHIVSTPFDDLLLRATLTWTRCSLRAAAGARSPSRRTGGSRSRWSRWSWDLLCSPARVTLWVRRIMVIEETNVYCSLFLLKNVFLSLDPAIIMRWLQGLKGIYFARDGFIDALIDASEYIYKRDFPFPFSAPPFMWSLGSEAKRGDWREGSV